MTDRQPVIWARLSEQGRGPARLLDYETITSTAMAIADSDGLDAVTMRAVAAELGRAPMSLYRHVGNRDDLTELMYDKALGELTLTQSANQDWQAQLAELARELRQLYHRHPWISRLGQRPTLGPNSIRLLEYSLATVGELGLTIDQMTDAVLTTMEFTVGFVREELGESEAQAKTGLDAAGWHEHTTAYVTELMREGTHPYFERFIREAEDFPNQDVVFERRLATVLGGVAESVARVRATNH
ncbi:MAG TPA: TetR/AcrR family transcriptional regulator [Galbitalea sp.]